ncbi:MAG: DNA-binding protein [Methanomicrobia archaeon]|nr:DNA-binding protein [Methanomicrobia archaeon]MCK4432471.1 DNA-binding protein [Methanomicrobia archaeon]MCK4636264.1 DNA-binding protein [Methanomicrobia archaeon]
MEDDIEDIRRKKMEELTKVEEQQRMEIQKQLLLRQILTNEARNRLVRIKMARPEFAEQIELQLIQLAQSGKLQKKITDEDLKTILRSLQQKKPDYRIMRR